MGRRGDEKWSPKKIKVAGGFGTSWTQGHAVRMKMGLDFQRTGEWLNPHCSGLGERSNRRQKAEGKL